GHEESAVADLGDPAAVLGADIHRHALADIAVGAHHQPGRAAAKSHRLRRRTERGERIDDGARADGGVAGDVDMGDKPATVRDHDVAADDAIRPDRYVLPDNGPRLDLRGR